MADKVNRQYNSLVNKVVTKEKTQESVFAPIPSPLLVERKNELKDQLNFLRSNFILDEESLKYLSFILLGDLKLQLKMLKLKDELHERVVQIVDYLKSLEQKCENKDHDETFFDFELKVSDFKRRNYKKNRSFEKKIEDVHRKIVNENLKCEKSPGVLDAYKGRFKAILKPKSLSNSKSQSYTDGVPGGHKWANERRVLVGFEQTNSFMDGCYIYICNLERANVYSILSLNLVTSIKIPKGCIPTCMVCVREKFYTSTNDNTVFVINMDGAYKKIKLPDHPLRLTKFGEDKLAIAYEKSISIYEPKTKKFEGLELPHSYLSIFKAIGGVEDSYYSVYTTTYSISKHGEIKIAKIQNGEVRNKLEIKMFDLENVKFITACKTSGAIYMFHDAEKRVSVYDRELTHLYDFGVDLMPGQSVMRVCVDENQNFLILTFSTHFDIAIIKYQIMPQEK